jgi:hypothetical protein
MWGLLLNVPDGPGCFGFRGRFAFWAGECRFRGFPFIEFFMSQNRLAILPNLTHYDIFMSPALPRPGSNTG